jgi:hypothetical protein
MSKAAELANLIGNINAGGGGVNRNVIINGAMTVAQRATSSTGIGASSGYFTCDRWKIIVGGTDGRLTMTQDSSAPSGFANSMKLDCTTADTSIASGEFLILRQMIEGQNLQAFAKGTSDAKPFAVSFYVKGNASATYNCVLGDADNTRQSVRQFTVGTDWSRVELTFPADTTGAFDDDNANSLEFNIILHAGSDLTSGSLNENVWEARDFTKQGSGISSFFDSTDRTFFLTGVSLEVGQNPTEFEHEPFERTLTKCQRYHEITDREGSDTYRLSMNKGNTSDSYYWAIDFKTTKRAKPTCTISQSYDDNLTLAIQTSATGRNHIGVKNNTGGSTDTRAVAEFTWTADSEL